MADAPAGPHEFGRRLAARLLDVGAVAWSPEQPFTWASGLKAPLYCDNRRTIAYPDVRRLITDGFARVIAEHHLAPDVIAGTATAGIPHAAWLADRLGLPMAYVRSKPKAHGQGRAVEGAIEAGQRVVVIEDLVSTGGSSLAAAEALRTTGAEVVAVLAIFSYGLNQSEAAFSDVRLPLFPLAGFMTLLDVAREEDRLDGPTLETLQAWRRDPEEWSARWEKRGGR